MTITTVVKIMKILSHLITMNALTAIMMELEIMMTMMTITMEFLIHKMHFHLNQPSKKILMGMGLGITLTQIIIQMDYLMM